MTKKSLKTFRNLIYLKEVESSISLVLLFSAFIGIAKLFEILYSQIIFLNFCVCLRL